MLTLDAQDGKPPIVVEDRMGSPLWPFNHPASAGFVPVEMRHEFFRFCGDLGWMDGRDSGPFLCSSGDVIVIKAASVTDTPDLEGVLERAEARAQESLEAYAAFRSQGQEDEDGEDVFAPQPHVQLPQWPADFLVRACDNFYLEVENSRGASSILEIFHRHFRPGGVGPYYCAARVRSHWRLWRQFRHTDRVWRAQLREGDALWSAVMHSPQCRL